jgi:hypothetical protein
MDQLDPDERITLTVCPVCTSPEARLWRRKVACTGCGLLWVEITEPPLSAGRPRDQRGS